MTEEEILLGVGITLALAVGSQIVASRLRMPALLLLLPAGFAAGAVTDVVHPDRLLGPAFAPLVMLSVAVILYDAGLGLDLSKLRGHTRTVVLRLIWLGVPITWAVTAVVGAKVLDLSAAAAVMLGAILVVSGPTVVGPLLDYVRPMPRLQRVLAWEGTLIDPVGAILAAVTLGVVVATTRPTVQHQVLDFLASVTVGAVGGAVGIAVLWLLLHRLDLSEVLGTIGQLAAVIVVAAVCDAIRPDSGLLAAILMGLAAANIRTLATAVRRPFFEALVQLILGLLFISISAGVTPESLRGVVLPTLVLVAVLVLVARPLVALLATVRTDLNRGEKAFGGWMAPRGIVAASTASTFAVTLVERGVEGAEKILPATFLVVVATVALYSLTARAVARRLRVVRPAQTRPLLVGGDPWVVDLGRALRVCGLDVLMWAGSDEERRRISDAGLEIASGELVAAAVGQGASIEGVNQILLLTREDDFNALASVILRGNVDGPVYRLAPSLRTAGVLAPYLGGEVLFRDGLGQSDVDLRWRAGGRIVVHREGDACPPDHEPLFVVRTDGRLDPHTVDSSPEPEPGDISITLSPSGRRSSMPGGDAEAR